MSTKKVTSKSKKISFKKKGFKLSSVIGLVLLIAAVIAGLYLVRQNQNIEEDAAGLGCRSYNNDKDACNSSCGGFKKDGSSYKCRFGKNGCVETSQKCTGGGGGGTVNTTCANLGNGAKCVGNSETCLGAKIKTTDCFDYCCISQNELPSETGCTPGDQRTVKCQTLPGYKCNIDEEKQYCGTARKWYPLGTKCVCSHP